MGSPECEWGRGANTETEHEVTLTHDFLLAATELTQAAWSGLVGSNPSTTSADVSDCTAPTCPVGNITWYEALEFANRYSVAQGLEQCFVLTDCQPEFGSGMRCASAVAVRPSIYDCDGYRLPTDAEWEYAARAGTRSATYGGDLKPSERADECSQQPALNEIAWYCANGEKHTHDVSQLKPNGWGLYDMAGNALELVLDVRRRVDGPEPVTDPGAVIEAGSARVARGGLASWPPVFARSAWRTDMPPWARGPGLGVRLARTLK